MFNVKHAEGGFMGSTSWVQTESQDVVIYAEGIEHVSEPEKLLSEFQGILMPVGRAVLPTP